MKKFLKVAFALLAGIIVFGTISAPVEASSLTAEILLEGGGRTNTAIAWTTTGSNTSGQLVTQMDIRNNATGALIHSTPAVSFFGRQRGIACNGSFRPGTAAFSVHENRTAGRIAFRSRAR